MKFAKMCKLVSKGTRLRIGAPKHFFWLIFPCIMLTESRSRIQGLQESRAVSEWFCYKYIIGLGIAFNSKHSKSFHIGCCGSHSDSDANEIHMCGGGGAGMQSSNTFEFVSGLVYAHDRDHPC